MKISRLQLFILDCIILSLAVVGFFLSHWMIENSPGCVFRKLGFLCPACGGTRCVRYFLEADFATAFRYNSYIFITIILAVIALVFLNITVFSKSKTCEKICIKLINYRTIILWAICFAVFGIVRNIL